MNTYSISRNNFFKLGFVTIAIAGFFILSVLLKSNKTQANTVCPLPTDAKTYGQTDRDGVLRCYSSTGLGLNTIGGRYTCGPVNCYPNTSTTAGNTCITKRGNTCFAGKGVSGYSDRYCNPASNVSVACPQPMPLYIKVVNKSRQSNARLSGYGFSIEYEDNVINGGSGKFTTAYTDRNGNAVISNMLYSGDHFIITAIDQDDFNPSVHGSKNNVGDQEMNTLWSCGQNASKPCEFDLTQMD